MAIVITGEELAQIKADSEAKGIHFDDRQMAKLKQILERRLEREVRVREKEFEQAKLKIQRDLERQHMEALQKSKELQDAAAEVRSLLDAAKEGYEELKQAHFQRVPKPEA